jgi:hypothetical protein
MHEVQMVFVEVLNQEKFKRAFKLIYGHTVHVYRLNQVFYHGLTEGQRH